jgi:hypothetical protein
VEGFPIVKIESTTPAIAIEPTNAFSGQAGFFQVSLSDAVTNNLTVYYKISGSAQNGVDYTNLPAAVTFSNGQNLAFIEIDPIQDNIIEFDEYVTLTLILTNGYVVDPQKYAASMIISDNFGSNIFAIATDVFGPGGIDYSPTTQSLIVSYNDRPIGTAEDGEPFNFERVFTNGISTNVFTTNFSGIHGMLNEIKLATVKANAAGFTVGDMYFGTGVNGIIGKLSADGTVSNLNFCTLTADGTNIDTLIHGSLYVDDSGSFGGDLIAVTGAGDFEGGWRLAGQFFLRADAAHHNFQRASGRRHYLDE